MKSDIKSDKELIDYVLIQIGELENFLVAVNEERFLSNNMLKDACLMKLMVIGEYTHRVSDSLKDRFSDIEWQLLKAARNFYAHMYGGVFWPKVWETLNEDIPALKKKLQNIQIELG